MDAQGELAPVPVTSITSMLTLHKIRAKVFEQLSLHEQRPLRLVCKDWDNAVRKVMRNMKKVRIGIRYYGYFYGADYTVRNMEDLLALFERHANVSQLEIISGHLINLVESMTTRLATLERLEYLELFNFKITSDLFHSLDNLPQLVSINFHACDFSSANLGYLSGKIRELSILEDQHYPPIDLPQAMRTLHARGIPLRKLFVDCSRNNPELFPVAKFMLENFASLRVLKLRGSSPEYVSIPIDPLKQMLAVNIEVLFVEQINWHSQSRQQQFFASLLAQPLPHLRILYFENLKPLDEDTMKRLWNMCPKLDEVYLTHKCDDQQCQERLRLAREKYQRPAWYLSSL